MMRWLLLVFCMLAAAPSAHAQQRALEVPATARWQHARSGVVLPVTVDGLRRTQIVENMPDELDVMAHYDDGDTRVSLFLYRPSLFDVGIWFDRAETGLRANAMLGTVTPAAPAPMLFAPPGAPVTSAMRQSYSGTGDYRARALAIVPTGRWLVKVRASSRTGTAEQVDARVDAALAALRFEAGAHRGPPARIVQPCAVAVRWRNAPRQEMTRQDSILGVLSAMVAGQGDGAPGRAGSAAFVPPNPDPALCRDAEADPRYAVYRDPAEAGEYVMAIGDAGASASVGRALSTRMVIGRNGEVTSGVSYFVGNQTMGYPNFQRVPSPRQVIELIERGRPTSTSSNDPDLVAAE